MVPIKIWLNIYDYVSFSTEKSLLYNRNYLLTEFKQNNFEENIGEKVHVNHIYSMDQHITDK